MAMKLCIWDGLYEFFIIFFSSTFFYFNDAYLCYIFQIESGIVSKYKLQMKREEKQNKKLKEKKQSGKNSGEEDEKKLIQKCFHLS